MNPYDTEELAERSTVGSEMTSEERAAGCAHMRASGARTQRLSLGADLIAALAALRLDMPEDERLAEQPPDSRRRVPGRELKKRDFSASLHETG